MMIRNAEIGDAEAICAIAREVSSNKNMTKEQAHDQYLTYIAYFLDHEPEHCFVAVDDREVVGYIVGTENPAKYEEKITAYRNRATDKSRIDHERKTVEKFRNTFPAHLHINLSARAQGKGMGHELLKAFERSVHSPIFLGVRDDRPQAIRFYEKEGFQEIEREPGTILFGKRA